MRSHITMVNLLLNRNSKTSILVKGAQRQVAVQPRTGASTCCQASRRDVLGATLSPLLIAAQPAKADVGPNMVTGSTGLLEVNYDGLPFTEDDFQFDPPMGFKFLETNPIVSPDRRGPAPERSPVRARFDSQDGVATISVVVRTANSIKPMLLQVTDISVYGSPEQTAQLLIPRGSTLLKAETLTVPIPPRNATMGLVTFPDRNYYKYEFITTNGLHVAMYVAAKNGRVYVCGASAPKDKWATYGPALKQSANTFMLRDK